jgi:hypothetical protein
MNDLTLSALEAQFTPRGPFMTRDGEARRRGSQKCNKKLCLVATDKEYLVRLLFGLVNDENCYFVKYSAAPKDGMHLGRVFLCDETRVALLWRKLRSDPKLMCSIQDDDFTGPFRDLQQR